MPSPPALPCQAQMRVCRMHRKSARVPARLQSSSCAAACSSSSAPPLLPLSITGDTAPCTQPNYSSFHHQGTHAIIIAQAPSLPSPPCTRAHTQHRRTPSSRACPPTTRTAPCAACRATPRCVRSPRRRWGCVRVGEHAAKSVWEASHACLNQL